ncbi:MAG: nicotinate-nucleotide adenylyltransferase [Lactobacillales bacterium]|jgi:nicotinate-nucleotide adenylyltransferase|nr:nicotinate-nucleotide adenylyltransferase [Lactobacillales bacterium]
MYEAKTKVILQTVEVTKRRQVGILGGNFNPVHNAHLAIADQVQQQLGLDVVYLMPEFLPPHIDEKQTICSEHRLNMLQLAVQNNPRLEIETIELHRGGKSFTYDTMKVLIEKNPDTDYYFIIGGDMVEYLPKWYKIDELVQMVQFVGVQRPGYKVGTSYPVIWVDLPKMDLSSSTIRKMFASNNEPRYMMPPLVIKYIQEKGLYLDEE